MIYAAVIWTMVLPPPLEQQAALLLGRNVTMEPAEHGYCPVFLPSWKHMCPIEAKATFLAEQRRVSRTIHEDCFEALMP